MARWSIPVLCLLLGGAAGTFVARPMLLGQNAAAPLVVPKEITSYRDVVKKVLPAVVSIESKVKPKARSDQQAPKRRRAPVDDQVPEEFRKFFDELERRQVEPDEVP